MRIMRGAQRILVKCFNFKVCNQVMEVSSEPVKLADVGLVRPRLEGPWICSTCRKQLALLKLARKIMSAKLGIKFKSPALS